MTDQEIIKLAGSIFYKGNNTEAVAFARAIESRTLTNKKAKWYQEGLEAGLREALAEPPKSATNVVEPETEEPLTLKEQREAQQQLENHLDAVYQRNNQAFLAQARLQELADYRLTLLTKMPSEWQWLTEDDIHDLFTANETVDDYGEFESIACAVSSKLKEKNEWKRDPRDMCGNE